MVMAREHAMQRLWVANAYFSIRFQAAELLRTEFLRSTGGMAAAMSLISRSAEVLANHTWTITRPTSIRG
jgi:hypothetical protein